jgi:bifunctional DNA-binding transcriptional regulator/antitoxin component of YhaV-PrlF toxin-antitoxin module
MRKISQKRVDEYGRIELPEEVMREVGIGPRDLVFITSSDSGEIFIEKWKGQAVLDEQNEEERAVSEDRLVSEQQCAASLEAVIAEEEEKYERQETEPPVKECP